MIQILAVVVLAVGVYTVAPSAETAQFFKLDSPAEASEVEVVKETTPPKERPTAALTASNEKRPKPPSPKPEPSQCREDQWVRADNGECLDKPKVETPSEPVAIEATPEPAPARVTSSGDCSLVNNYNWDTRLAYAVCMAESGGNTYAANYADDHGQCVGSFGLMQLACFWTPNPTDPGENMAKAYEIYSNSGWQPWGAYTSGDYLRYY